MPSITKQLFIFSILFASLAGAFAPSTASSEERIVATTVTVGEMCGGCVKRITAHFDKVKAIGKIKCDIEKKTVALYPAANVKLSPKKVWEAMESLGKKPSKLVSPSGTFTSKPNN